ncbi:GGDEF domain-containing protein (plasmid) [Deinococcus taeanensis]|uniref:putative bifunctional diguanylate cyclase/phosphodiesterase n=1 Tax=Deinococcus taeanensis TaxID=2737050 RepID=UPI001CDCB7D0|nr:GGDEF domain-containing protein [Deinococcus taeanensis]UBV45310.1 GGDEF domain-containing protein [Deinococcus taeanensis]
MTLPANETERLALLHRLQLLDTLPEQEFDDLAALAAVALQAPMALVSLVDEDRQWFKANIGLNMAQSDRSASLCAHALHSETLLVVPDATLDPRFRETPLVTGAPHLRFYAGAPLTIEDGLTIGTLCVLDTQPRAGLTKAEAEILRRLADLVVRQIRLRSDMVRQLDTERAHREALERRIRERTQELAQISLQARRDALCDPLTGLGNRALFQQRLQLLLEPQRRRAAVVLLDCDRFKQLNDTFGHGAGDDLLRQLAARLASELRAPDVISRLGGDEFGLLIEGIDTQDAALAVTQRVRQAVERPVVVQGREWPVQVSVGVVLLHGQYDAVDAVLRDADIAMNRAKQRTQDKVEVFETGMHTALLARTTMEEELWQALRDGCIHPHFQPLVRVHDGRLYGFEALARWTHPERGPISPAVFIPAAEDSGLIIDLDRHVFRQACEQFRAWHERGVLLTPLTLSVNASARQFLRPDFAPFIQEVLEDTGVTPELVHVEITESLMLEHTPTVSANLTALRSLGVHLHIDDFGTGYSSLAYVQRLSASALKIDRSFTTRIGHADAGEELVRAILGMARALGMHVVAEGVETAEQWAWLREAGCDLAQGFHFSRPLDAQAAEAWMQRDARLELEQRRAAASD